MAYNDALKALREIEEEQRFRKDEAMENTVQKNLMVNPKAILGLVGARMALRQAAMVDDSQKAALEATKNLAETGSDKLADTAVNTEPGILHGIFKEPIIDPITEALKENPYLVGGGIGAGALGLMGLYGLKDRLPTQQSITDVKKQRAVLKNSPRDTNLIADTLRASGNASKSMSRTFQGAFLGTQALGMAGVPYMSDMAMPLLGAGMALRSPVGAAAVGAGLANKFGLLDLANSASAADAHLGFMQTGMAALPSMIAHGAAAPLSLASNIPGLGVLNEASTGLGAAGDSLSNYISGDPITAAIGGGLSMILAQKGIGKGLEFAKNAASTTKLLKEGKAIRPPVITGDQIEKTYDGSARLMSAVRNGINMQLFSPFESYNLSFLGYIARKVSLLQYFVDKKEDEERFKTADVNLAQNNIQTLTGQLGDDEFDLKRPGEDRSKEELAPEHTLTRWFQDKSIGFGKLINRGEEALVKASIKFNPLNYIIGGDSSPIALLEEFENNKIVTKAKQKLSEMTGESMEFVEAKNVSVTSLLNDADTFEGKVINILGTMLPLAQERNFYLKDLLNIFGVTPAESSAGELGRIVDTAREKAEDLDEFEEAKRHSRKWWGKLPVIGLLGSHFYEKYENKLKKAGKLNPIEDSLDESVKDETDFFKSATGMALPFTKTGSTTSADDTDKEIEIEQENEERESWRSKVLETLVQIEENTSHDGVPSPKKDEKGSSGFFGNLFKSVGGKTATILGGILGAIVGGSGLKLAVGAVSKISTVVAPFIMSNPITAVLAVAGLAAWYFWDEITEWVSDTWTETKEYWSGIWTGIKDAATELKDKSVKFIKDSWHHIQGWFGFGPEAQEEERKTKMVNNDLLKKAQSGLSMREIHSSEGYQNLDKEQKQEIDKQLAQVYIAGSKNEVAMQEETQIIRVVPSPNKQLEENEKIAEEIKTKAEKIGSMEGDPDRIDTVKEMTALLTDIKNDSRTSAFFNGSMQENLVNQLQELVNISNQGMATLINEIRKLNENQNPKPIVSKQRIN